MLTLAVSQLADRSFGTHCDQLPKAPSNEVLDRRFHAFTNIQLAVRQSDWKPSNDSEAFELARYMALFERINQLVDGKILDLKTVDQLYGWRLKWRLVNDTVQKDFKSQTEPSGELSRRTDRAARAPGLMRWRYAAAIRPSASSTRSPPLAR
jgi:hypothetical protein